MKILFLCVANSARSQLAEGLAKRVFAGDEIQSAGSSPANLVNPYALKVLEEEGIDISDHHPKTYDDLPATFRNQIDYVITLCAEEICPTVPVGKKLHWPLPDPAAVQGTEEEKINAFRKTREEIKKRLELFSTLP